MLHYGEPTISKEQIKKVSNILTRKYITQGNEVKNHLLQLESVESVDHMSSDHGIERYGINLSGSEDARPHIYKLATKNNWVLWELHEEQMKLEDVFQTLTVADENQREKSS